MVDGDRLELEPQVLLEWDYSFGADAPTSIYPDYPYEHFYDDAQFSIDGETLTLQYTAYPADAPEPATLVLHRVQ
jgi:hypothetical protein